MCVCVCVRSVCIPAFHYDVSESPPHVSNPMKPNCVMIHSNSLKKLSLTEAPFNFQVSA